MIHGQEQRRPGRPRTSSEDVPTSNRILQTASQLFMEHGYDGVSMGQVADRCGVTKAVVYYYFSAKANLFTEAMVHMLANIRQRTLDILKRDEPLYDRLLFIMRTRLRIATPLDFNSILRSGKLELADSQIEQIRTAEAGLFDTVADAFREASERGQLREVDAILAARVYMALLMIGKTELEHSDEPINIDIRAQQLLEFMWMGVEKR